MPRAAEDTQPVSERYLWSVDNLYIQLLLFLF